MAKFGEIKSNENLEDINYQGNDGKTMTILSLDERVTTLESEISQMNPSELQDQVQQLQDGKQDILVSGTNIKTINGKSILGSGNIVVAGEGGTVTDEALQALNNNIENHVGNSQNPHGVTKGQIGLDKVVNQTITVTSSSVSDGVNTFNQFDPTSIQTSINGLQTAVQSIQSNKQDNLVSGTSIKTINGQSILGSGNIVVETSGGTEHNWSEEINAVGQEVLAHIQDSSNPHGVTKSQIGLGNVENKTITVTSSSVSDGTNTFSQFDPSDLQSAIDSLQTSVSLI